MIGEGGEGGEGREGGEGEAGAGDKVFVFQDDGGGTGDPVLEGEPGEDAAEDVEGAGGESGLVPEAGLEDDGEDEGEDGQEQQRVDHGPEDAHERAGVLGADVSQGHLPEQAAAEPEFEERVRHKEVYPGRDRKDNFSRINTSPAGLAPRRRGRRR